MSSVLAGIPDNDWDATPPSVLALVENHIAQLEPLAAHVAQLQEQRGCSWRNSSKPPTMYGPDQEGFGGCGSGKARGKGFGRPPGGPAGAPRPWPQSAAIGALRSGDRASPPPCQRCSTALGGVDSQPLRHQVVEIPPMALVVIEHQLHRLLCPCCATRTAAVLPEGAPASGYGPRLSALMGLLAGPTESQAQGGWCGHAGAGFVGTALVPWPGFLPALI